MRLAVQVSFSMPATSKVCARPRCASSGGRSGLPGENKLVLLKKQNAANSARLTSAARKKRFMRTPRELRSSQSQSGGMTAYAGSVSAFAQENVVGRVGRAEERTGLLARSVVAPAHRIDALHGGDARERAAAAAGDDLELEPGNVLRRRTR